MWYGGCATPPLRCYGEAWALLPKIVLLLQFRHLLYLQTICVWYHFVCQIVVYINKESFGWYVVHTRHKKCRNMVMIAWHVTRTILYIRLLDFAYCHFWGLFSNKITCIGSHFVRQGVSYVNKRPFFIFFACAPCETDISSNIGLLVMFGNL